MIIGSQVHDEKMAYGCELLKENEVDWAEFSAGIPEEEYHGQNIWDGEKLVTQEEWDMQQREEAIRQKLREG